MKKTNSLIILSCIILLNSVIAVAQYCTPTYTYACASDDIINTFTIASINNSGSGCNGQVDNYQNTGMLTALKQGNTYVFTIQAGGFDEGFGIWIDYNQDSTFDDAGEFVWASAFATQALLTDSFIIPVSAPTGLTRMRVRCIYNTVPVDADYCSLHDWGETEDYDIIISSDADLPITSFMSDVQKTCDGVINFTDLSGNDPTSWSWDFGDSNTDNIQNPSHTYSSPGTYTVTLISTNANGSDTSIQSNYIEKVTSDTVGYTEDFEVGTEGSFVLVQNSESYSFVFADGANSSSFGLILCGNSLTSWTNPVAGAEFTTNPSHNASASLCFDASSAASLVLIFDYKMIFQFQDYYTNFRITVNGDSVTSTYQTAGATTNWSSLVIDLSAYVGSAIEIAFETSCKYVYNNGGADVGNGVYIDNIQFTELTTTPTTAFVSDFSKVTTCNGDVAFTDNSLFSPTSWLWDFGDGNTSTDQNPTHTYSAKGTYDVTLITTNGNGNDTLNQIKLIEVLGPQPLAYSQDFELGTSSLDDFVQITNSESKVMVRDTAANGSAFGLILSGYTNIAWTNPAAGDEFTSNPDHFSSARLCVDASALSSLMLNFDYKLIYQYQDYYTNFRVTVNGTMVDSLHQTSGSTTAWRNKTIDLSAYAGGLVEIAFEANCKYRHANAGLDVGNGVYIDNILIKKVDSAPITSFSVDVTNTCEGTVSLIDNSLFGPTSWLWDFGDSSTDTAQNPTHTYASPGLYTITLITTNAGGNDTLQKVDYVNVMSSQAIQYLQDFELGTTTINDFAVVSKSQSNVQVSDSAANSSSFGLILAGNSATSWTNPAAGDEFTTNPDHFASTTLCIDATSATSLALIFDYKLLYQFQDYYTNFRVMINGVQFGNIYQTAGATTGWNTEVLDLSAYAGGRVEVTFQTNCKYNHANGGSDVGNGVYIDNILIKEMDDPPIAGINSDVIFSCDGIVNFKDVSAFDPTSWLWDFGDGVTDTAQNPTHTYTKDSVYTVALAVSNIFGNDSTSITNYITVELGSYKCDTSFMPDSGSATFTNCDGLLLDSGGDADYQNNTDGIITIAPPGSTITNVVIIFNFFDFEVGFDYLYIYDGPDTSSTLIGKYDGISLPEGGRWTSSGPYVTLRQTSDAAVIGGGFVMEWNCVDAASPPYASFIADNVSSCDGLVTFTDNSIPSPTNWLWDFGDGQTDTSQNPSHQYSGVGSYDITLIVSNPYGADSTTIANYINVVGAGTLPYFQSFDVDSTTNDFIIITNNESNVDVVSNIGESNTPAIVLDGSSASGWVNPAAGKEFIVNPDHFSSATICTNDTSTSTLLLIFDYKLIYQYQGFYTNFRVTVNGDQIGNIYQPAVGTSNWTREVLDISSYSGSELEISFEANCKYPYNNGGNDVGNGVYIDSIFIKEVDVPPVSAFASLSQFTCDGIISFKDQSIYAPHTWLWDFGDGTTSSNQNPDHTYIQDSTYTVTLISWNDIGSDTVTMVDYVKVQLGGTYCDTLYMPLTGILVDSSCTGVIYDDGGAMGYYSNNVNASITIKPTDAVRVGLTFTDLRTEKNSDYLRIYDGPNTSSPMIAEYTGDTLPNDGKIIYSSDSIITIAFQSDNSVPDKGFALAWECFYLTLPNADYTVDRLANCLGSVTAFEDLSENFPNSWYWNFGDGNTSTDQNPSHTYADTGDYTVMLVATNAKGEDTLIITDYISINESPSAASCLPDASTNCCGVGIHYVKYNTIENTSDEEVDYYQDFTCSYFTTVLVGSKDTIEINTGNIFEENVRVWIDYNNDAVFDNKTEIVFSSDDKKKHSGTILTPDGVVTNMLLRMRIASDYNGVKEPEPCDTLVYGQSEDYGVVIKASAQKPEADYTYDILDACNYIVQFDDYSSYIPTNWSWSYKDSTIASGVNTVTHQFDGPGIYWFKLIASNAYGNDTIVKKIVLDSVRADFSQGVDSIMLGDTIQFNNSSTNSNKWSWNFGDPLSLDNESNNKNPTHAFTQIIDYEVNLIASNSKTGCADTVSKTITVYPPTGIDQFTFNSGISIAPIPSKGKITISYQFNTRKKVEVSIYNVIGDIIFNEEIKINKNSQQNIDLSEKAKGIYFVKIETGNKNVLRKIIIE